MDLTTTTETLKELQVYRRSKIKMQLRIENNCMAMIRRWLGWKPDLPDTEAKSIKAKAKAIAKAIWAGEPGDAPVVLVAHCMNGLAAMEPYAVERAKIEKQMTALAATLPVHDWYTSIKGCGVMGLAVIIGETGNLSNYVSPAKVWKRMGLAVMDGVRQGGLPKGSDAELWIEHGYNRARRSAVWTIGDSLTKSQIHVVRDKHGNKTDERIALGEYGQTYLDRKQYELDRDPEMKPIIAHRRAQRYMEKRLLKHLWQQWRKACSGTDQQVVDALSTNVRPEQELQPCT